MRIIAIAICALILFSCDDDKDTASSDDVIKAEKNGMSWEGHASANFSQYAGDTLFIFGQGAEEVLVMKIKFTGTGNYSLGKNQGNYYTTIGGDVLTSEYKTDGGTYTGGVKITRYDEVEEIIEGNFIVSLKQIRSNPQNGIDAVSFTRGQFKTKIIRY